MPADYNVIDRFLRAYLDAIDSGFGLIQPDVMNVFGLLIVISIGITAVFWALDESNAVIAGLFRKVLLIGFFTYLLSDWPGITKSIVLGFAQIGIKAGGGGVNVSTFLTSPSDLIYMGMKLVTQMTIQLKQLSGPVSFFENFAIILIIGAAALGVVVSFVVLAVQVFVLIIEFRLVTLAAFILIPFGILKQTSFLSDRALGYVVSAGLKVLSIAVVVTVGSRVFKTLTLTAEPSIESAVSILIAAVVLMMLALTVPSIAASLITGGPQISAGGAVAGVAGVAAVTGAAYLAGRAALSAPGSIVERARAAAGAGSGSAPTGPSSSPNLPRMQPPNPPSGGPTGGNDNGGSGARKSGPAPSSAPSPAETVRRAQARQGIIKPANLAGASIAAANSQGGAGITPNTQVSEG